MRQLCVQTARGAGRLLLCMLERVRAAPSSQYKSAKRLYCEEFCTHQKNKAFISNMIMQLTNPKKARGTGNPFDAYAAFIALRVLPYAWLRYTTHFAWIDSNGLIIDACAGQFVSMLAAFSLWAPTHR